MKYTLIIPFCGLALFGSHTAAADISYDYIDGAYQSLDFEGVDGDGFAIDFSHSFSPMLFGQARYTAQSFEEGGVELDWTVIDLGVGGHWALSPNADFVLSGGVALVDMELTVPGFGSGSDDDTGFFIEPGLRVMVTDQLELHGSAYYLDAFDDSQTNIEIGARYLVTPNLSLNVAYLDEDDVDGFSVGARFNF